MRASKSIWSVIVIALLIVTSSLLLAQNADTPTPAPESGALAGVWSFGQRVWMGVRLSDITSSQISQLKLSGDQGAVITEVEKNSPAAKAGLEANDVVLAFDGERVRSVAELRRLVRETPAGRTISVEVSRDGHRHKFNLTLEAHPERGSVVMPSFEMHMPAMTVPEIRIPSLDFNLRGGPSRLGITGDDLTPQLAKFFGVSEGKGVLVTSVVKGSPAEKAGLEAGDCIVKVDTTLVGSVWELRRALSENSRDKREVNLSVVRGHAPQQLRVELEAEWHAPPLSAEQNDELKDLAPEMEELEQEINSHQGDLQRSQREIQRLQREIQRQALERSTVVMRQNMEQLRRALEQQAEAWKQQKEQWRDHQRRLQKDLRLELRSLGNARAIV